MEAFSELFERLDRSTKTNDKVDALAQYFATAQQADRLWALALLAQRRPKRPVSTTLLRLWAAEQAGLPLWLFEEAYHVVGDLAESIALLLPAPRRHSRRSLSEWVALVQRMGGMDEAGRKATVLEAWDSLDQRGRFVFNKVLTGNLRVGVSQQLMVRALAKATGQDAHVLAHRLMGDWSPDTVSWEALLLGERQGDDRSVPYPFCLAYPLEEDPAELGQPGEWQAEYKWDGIRGQLIVRGGQLYVWSRGEELLSDKFPELAPLASALPDGTVLDGEILAMREGEILPFSVLQTRIGRKQLSKKILAEAPLGMMCYDLLEWQGRDLRARPLAERRALLEGLLASDAALGQWLRLSAALPFADWAGLAALRAEARERHSEGLMLKRLSAPYHSGRRRGDWWKWKLAPLSIDAVLIYAQRGHGRRANLYTDYTFAVWDGAGGLVPFAKAYSGLTDAEFEEVTRFVRRHTLERFGPVCSVQPSLVFELAFEGIQASARHKSGIALRFPRIARWRRDKPAAEADTLADLQALLAQYG